MHGAAPMRPSRGVTRTSAHRTEECDGGGRFGAGFLRSAVPGIQRAKSKVTVGQERCHPQFQGRNTPR